MNKKEKQWIKESLYKILVTDIEEDLDCQADDIENFLAKLANYVGLEII